MSDRRIEVTPIGYLEGHNGWVTCLTVGKDQNNKPLLVSGSRDKSLIVWDLDLATSEESKDADINNKVGKPNRRLHGHSHFVSSLSMARESRYVVSGSWDKTLRLWDLNTMKTKQLFTGHTKDVLAVSFSQDNRMILSGSMDKTLRFWNIKGEHKFVSDKFNGWVSSITHVKQGKDSLLAVGAWDSKVRIFDSELSYNRGIEVADYAITSMASDDEGEYLFVGQKNGSVKIWSLATDENGNDTLKQTIDANADLNTLSFESTFFSMISLGTSKGICIKDIRGNSDIFKRSYGKNVGCLSLAWDANKEYLFAGFTDGYIRVFKVNEA